IQYGKYIKTKYIVSLHEVCDHSNPDFDHPNKVLKYLFSNKVPIILFSDKSTEDIKKYKGAVEENLYRVNFGQFDSFKIFQGEKHLDLPSHYVLFIGRFTPYKGLRLFYEATKELASKGYHFVVAGSGNDEAIEDLKRIPNFTIINRYLSNRDFVELVERSSFIVCPYTSMSQSGIPQTAFVFNKPIIATDLDGFKEIIQNGRNGLLFSSNNKLELSEYINLLIENNSYLNELIEGVGMFEKLFPKYSWKEITETYIKDFITCQEHYS
ncbi:MAG: glycosyltransferase, partial [Bacilli bacterium]|nr:glycosyltransferase [Bacilli bacterium]